MDPVLGLLGPIAGVVHRVLDVLQTVPLGGQGVVDAVQALQQSSVHICRVQTPRWV